MKAHGYESRVEVHKADTGTCLVLPANVQDIVSFQGSFISLPEYEQGEGLIRDLTISMLDKGTRAHKKTELARLLEDVGAEIYFSTDGVRVRVFGRALRRDLPFVLSLLGEQLQSPAFPEDELLLLKNRFEAAFLRSLTQTSKMSSSALSRRLFDPEHPNYTPDPRKEIARLEEISTGDLREYFSTKCQTREWTLSLVGDIDWGEIDDVVEKAYPGSGGCTKEPYPDWPLKQFVPGREEIHIDDRDNIDVCFGHPLSITNLDPAYIPLYVGNFVLGGNFSARLMSIIRDEMGLTYGIYSSLSEMDCMHRGIWNIGLTLSQANLESGIVETTNQLRKFVDSGISEDELEEKKLTIVGSYLVAQSSTRGLAGSLLRNAEKRREPGYLDQFPGIIESLSLEEVNRAISTHLDVDRLHVVLAGSLEH